MNQANQIRIRELANLVMEHKRRYYAGKPTISDQIFDRYEEELRSLDPQHPALTFVGSDPSSLSKKADHKTPMLSLEKTYVVEDLFRWTDGRPVVGMLKIDGNSLSVVYRDGILVQAKTRGNGLVGEDVTDKIRWVSDIPRKIAWGGEVEVRGELYCTETQFLHLVAEFRALNLEPPTNPRNIVAGLLGRKTHYNLCRYFNFFAFEYISEQANCITVTAACQQLHGVGFVTPQEKLCKTNEEISSYLELVQNEIEKDEIGIDGAVFSYEDMRLHGELGSTSHHPRYRISFKWQGQTAESKIKRIDWFTSRFGVVTPVAVIEPVNLSGAKISNVTLHNVAHVESFNLKTDDTIEIVRSGEVIPKFLRVVKSSNRSLVIPTACSDCGTTLHRDDIRIFCPNQSSCPAQQLGRILNYIQSVEIEDLSEKRLRQLLDLGLVRTLSDLYTLNVDDFMTMPQTKEKMAKKLFTNIMNSKSPKLPRFLNGLGIQGMGLTSWEKLVTLFGDLETIRKLKTEDISRVEGFAEKTADQVVNGLLERTDLIDQLLTVGITPVSTVLNSDGPLSGKQIAITGSLSVPRSQIEQQIKDAGGHPTSSVSKHTHAVVTADPTSTSTKMQKARSLNVPIWDENTLAEMINRKQI